MNITIDGFEQLTKQQMFDMAFAHINSTGVPSVLPGTTTCTYSGSGCNAAVLIKPELRVMADETNQNSWGSLVSRGLAPSHEREFIQGLQLVHDRAVGAEERDFIHAYNRGMRYFAAQHGLIVPNPEVKL